MPPRPRPAANARRSNASRLASRNRFVATALLLGVLVVWGSDASAQPVPPPVQQVSFSEIREVVRSYRADIDACWPADAERDTTVRMTFNILPNGEPSSIVAYDAGPVADCLVAVVELMLFPEFDGIDPQPVRFLFGYYTGLTGWPAGLF